MKGWGYSSVVKPSPKEALDSIPRTTKTKQTIKTEKRIKNSGLLENKLIVRGR
jgi:hypothetical protein